MVYKNGVECHLYAGTGSIYVYLNVIAKMRDS